MSRKSSWWLRPQRKGASNRAALNEANYFMKHNKVLRERIKELAAENAKLLEQTELLITLLRNDCDIEASWDGLRHFWSIELTDDGCLMRDRACKAEAENAKLTKLARWMYQVMDESCAVHYPYEPAPVSKQALMRAEKELQALGIEV